MECEGLWSPTLAAMKLRQGWGTRRLYALTLASRAQATFEIIALEVVKTAPASTGFLGL
jgi:hypothetical protein